VTSLSKISLTENFRRNLCRKKERRKRENDNEYIDTNATKGSKYEDIR
jgi:hypothetical protein